MALPFDAGEDFAFDKPALHPCPHLGPGLRCSIHDTLRDRGFPGCARYDCLGAGQRLLAEVFPGADWRRDPSLRLPLAEGFSVLRRIHAALELISAAECLTLPPAQTRKLSALRALFHPETDWTPETLRRFDIAGAERALRALLRALRDHV
ncbi:MAG: hypothetical protein Kow0013_06350 [Pararhodobacter sp.]